MFTPERKVWMWSAMQFTSTEETDRECLRWQWHWSLQATAEMLGPGFVWSVGLQALGYPPTWVDLMSEAEVVKAACLVKLKEKLK